jgi:excisionase family DNA binding protein
MSEELSPSEAARRIGTTTRSIQRWIALRRLPARRVGGRWRVASDALDAFVAGAPDPRTTAPASADAGRAGVPTGTALRSIGSVFVANRGEIVERIRRTASRLGIRVVVPATDGPEAIDLLDIPAVVAAACAADADAVHPGFGFLAESAPFATAVEAAGLRWIGPPPDVIRAMGDKATARRLAASLGVPILPGYDDSDQTDEALQAAAGRIGLPLLVKPSAGGGGKGMRVVRDRSALRDALASARREALAAFGDDRLILERMLEGPRHVEVQVLFDAHGAGIALGERDCSIQRRHQKILEETPSPAVSPELRARLEESALALGRAVGYVSAGTCEFLLDDRGEAVFLEMNTRLQVEHPVTELVTGRDLVADQIRIAAGERLDAEAPKARPGGHAVEVRLYAEDAEAGFLPATGRVELLRWPTGEGIRIDAGIERGTEVTGRFDPMLAKIVAHGADRDEAFERLAHALDETVVLGLTTNLRFLRWLVRHPVVLDGEARIDTLDRIWPPDDLAARAEPPVDAWTIAAEALAGRAMDPSPDPWAGGWRLNGPPTARIAGEGAERMIAIRSRPTGGTVPAFASVRSGDTVHVDVEGRSVPFRPAPPPDVERAAQAASGHAGGAADLVAPMPGRVLTVHVDPGATVAAGDPVVTLEAMKMEHAVVSPLAGRVGSVEVRVGDQVARGDRLASVEP